MSMFHTDTVACPKCGELMQFDINFSLAADRRPDLREEILDGTFQQEDCPECGQSFRLDPEMTYLDATRKQYILVQPANKLSQWTVLEQHARHAFEQAYGNAAPALTRAMGQGMSVRVTFGWAALREKILAAENGLDDVTLELVKLALMRGRKELPLADDVELRLGFVQEGQLEMAWLHAASEVLVNSLQVPRALYDEIQTGGAEWAELRESISAGPYVDVNRLLVQADAATA